jgi:hypothetical protein
MAERQDLENRIRQLESRGRILSEAEARLGMRKANASDMVFLTEEAS